jgi:methylated-DNA-[protein]-cysteine S-methyltransferase
MNSTRIEQELRAAAGALSPRTPSPDALAAVAARAEREGLVDVAYAQADSPFGPLTVAATERGLVLLAYPERPLDDVLGKVAAEISPRVLDPVRRELDEYFAGERKRFDLPIDWRLARGEYFRAVLHACARIAYGDTITYREIAARAGRPSAVRAAGNGLGSNWIPIVVPCHRVVATGGGLGGYTGGLERKEHLLALERGELALDV